METLGFLPGVVQVLRVLQQQPSGPLEDLLVQLLLGFPVHFATQIGQFAVEQLEHVEVVEDDDRLGQMGLNGMDIGGRQVHGHGLDRRTTAFQAFPEGVEGLGPLAVSHKHDRPGVQVQNHGEVSMSSTDGDFIDGDPTQGFEFAPAEPATEGTLLDAPDQVPTDPQMLGHISDGHVVGQLQNVSLEGMRVGASLVGKIHRRLADLAAIGTSYPRHIQRDLNGPRCRWKDCEIIAQNTRWRRWRVCGRICKRRLRKQEARADSNPPMSRRSQRLLSMRLREPVERNS